MERTENPNKVSSLLVNSVRIATSARFQRLPDVPENYQTVTIELSSDEDRTLVSLTQDGSVDEETRQHSEQNWGMLASLKKTLEK